MKDFRVLDYRENDLTRSHPKVRKKMISELKDLTCINDRGITINERKVAEAFIRMGKEGEGYAREMIRKQKEQSHKNYIMEIREARQIGASKNIEHIRFVEFMILMLLISGNYGFNKFASH